jgi:DNA-3-methyladenine glycosylase I
MDTPSTTACAAWPTPRPAQPLSDELSKALKKRGFRFVGSTICYLSCRPPGPVNDHTTDCFRHREVAALSSRPL